MTPSLNCSREFRVCSVIGTKVTCFFVKNEEVCDKKKVYRTYNYKYIYIEYKMYLQLPYVADGFIMHLNDGYAHEKHISI